MGYQELKEAAPCRHLQAGSMARTHHTPFLQLKRRPKRAHWKKGDEGRRKNF